VDAVMKRLTAKRLPRSLDSDENHLIEQAAWAIAQLENHYEGVIE